MKRLLIFLITGLLISACGTQEYADPPPSSQNSVFHSGNPPPPTYPRRDLTQPQSRDSLLEWTNFNPSLLEDMRCGVGDGVTVRISDSLGAAFYGGAIIGVVAAIGGHFFLGKPSSPTGGADPHQAESISSDSQYVWHKPWHLLKETVGNAAGAGTAAFACQAALTGEFIPTDGILGPDYSAFSAALVLGMASAVVVDPWVSRYFPKKSAEDIQKATVKPAPEIYGPPSPLTGPPKGPEISRGQQVKDWANAAGGFAQGVWYRISPSLAVLGISGGFGYGIGVLVYNHIQDGYAAPGCDNERSKTQSQAQSQAQPPGNDAASNPSPFQESVFE